MKNAPLERRKRGNQGTKTRRRYKSIRCAFDIETSRISESESVMYIWQFQAGPDHTIIGRSWKECFRFFRALAACCADDEYIVIFVHNLSFEFQWLRSYYHFTDDEVFATGPRRILKADMMDHLEFRCSYLHSNMSLAAYCKQMQVEHKKLSGKEFDYDKIRYPWTPLSDRELEYCLNDVRGLVEAVTAEMQRDGDNLYTFPLTSTGYVRRDVKRAMRELSPWYVKDMLPDWETYTLLREAFRGGNTHASRLAAGWIIPNVKSADISSSYPSAECNNRFPVSNFKHETAPSMDRLMWLIEHGYAVLARVSMWGVKLKYSEWGCPYLPTDKCRNMVDVCVDNGRILAAGYCEITVTDIDLKIILSEYKMNSIDVTSIDYARYGWLPDPLVDVIERYYRTKTELKGSEDPDDVYLYGKDKAKLNSVYGMSAQNPVRVPMHFDDQAPDSFVLDWDAYGPELLAESNKKAFFPYQWGIWCTALARFRLEQGLRLAHGMSPDLSDDVVHDPGGAMFIYCDTDSVKYIGEIDWDAYNKERILDAEASLAYADDRTGKRHYMGVYEDDGEYIRFATRGAKKYAYTARNKKGYVKLHITIAGVNKEAGAKELAAAGGLRAFLRENFTFSAGETEAVYIDHIREFRYYEGHRLRITPGVTIRPSFKTLSDTQEYIDLLKDPNAFDDLLLDKYMPI